MIYQRRTVHHMADRSIRLMPIEVEPATLYDRAPWLFWIGAPVAVLLAAWVSM